MNQDQASNGKQSQRRGTNQNAKMGRVNVGHPVDVATGNLFLDFEDYVFPGRMPLIFGRRYSGTLAGKQNQGVFGEGWSSPFEMRIKKDLEGYCMIDRDGETEIFFDDWDNVIPRGGSVRDLGSFHEIRKKGKQLIVSRWNPDDADDIVHYFFGNETGDEDAWWPLIALRDADGQGIDVLRDKQGRIVELKQIREQRSIRLVYNQAGRVIEVFARTPILRKRAMEASTALQYEERLVLRYSYDKYGRLSEGTDALHQRCRYTYDSYGRLIREVNIGGMVYLFRYDEEGHCIENSGEDGFGLVKLEVQKQAQISVVTNSLDQCTTYKWNDSGQVVKEISPFGNTRTTAYDKHGRIVKEISPSGASTSYEYDQYGDRVKVTLPSGAATKYQYNDQHQIVTVIDPMGHHWQRTYDSYGRVVCYTNPLGEKLSYAYNQWGDIVSMKDDQGNLRVFEWDWRGNLVSASDWLGHTTKYEYNCDGILTAIIDPLGHRTEAKVDALGRIRELYLQDRAKRQFTWNAYGQITTYTDELGRKTSWSYARCGALQKMIRPHGGHVRFDWNSEPGQLVGLVNERGERWQFVYDAEKHLIEETDFAGRVSCYEYDSDGQIVAITNHSKQRTKIDRNENGEPVAITYDDKSEIVYEYDDRGLMIKADNGVCSVEWKYDQVGQPVYEKQGDYEIFNKYDNLGYRVQRKSSLGHQTSLSWDANGQLQRMIQGSLKPLHFSYNARQEETARMIKGRLRIDASFNYRGRRVDLKVSSDQASAGNQAIIDRKHEYDAASNLTKLVDKDWGTTQYTYDLVNRIVRADFPNGLTERLGYDATDNIKSIDRVTKEVESDGSRRCCSYQQFDYKVGNTLVKRGKVIYQYDELGQLVKKIDQSNEMKYETTEYQWNQVGQLVGVTLPSKKRWQYKYDPIGRRIEKKGPDETVRFVWDGDVVLHEVKQGHDANTAEVVSWEFDPYSFEPILKVEENEQYLCINDVNGSPRELVSEDSKIVWSKQFSTWGRELQTESSKKVKCPVRYQGQWQDEETGLHYNRFRYYDPQIGRYLSTDPIGLNGGFNSYTYATNTIKWIDPFGLQTLAEVDYVDSYLDELVAMSKPSTKSRLIKKHRYENPGHHDPNSGNYIATKSVLPDDHVELFNKSKPVKGKDGKVTRWTKVVTKNGTVYHRFQEHRDGTFHWNGSTDGLTKSRQARRIPENVVPSEIKKCQ